MKNVRGIQKQKPIDWNLVPEDHICCICHKDKTEVNFTVARNKYNKTIRPYCNSCHRAGKSIGIFETRVKHTVVQSFRDKERNYNPRKSKPFKPSKKSSRKLTFGEAWFIYKQRLNSLQVKFDDIPSLPSHKPRMSRSESNEYYNQKLNDVWDKLGYKRDYSARDDIELFADVESYPDVDLEGHDKIDHLYDFKDFERLRDRLFYRDEMVA